MNNLVGLFRRRQRGSAIILSIGTTLVGLMIVGFAVDMGILLNEQNVMQGAAEAGALAGINQFLRSTGVSVAAKKSEAAVQAQQLVKSYGNAAVPLDIDTSKDVILGFIDPTTRQYKAAGFSTPSNDPTYSATGGYNALAVQVRKAPDGITGQLPTLMMGLVGANTMSVSALGVAMLDANVQQFKSGLRPFYGCMAQYKKAIADGNASNNVARIYGSLTLDGSNVTGCPSYTAGNWGYADLRDASPGAPGVSTLRTWITNGFNAPLNGTTTSPADENIVYVDRYYSTQPGNSINAVSSEIQTLINNKTVIAIPLVDALTGSGSNTKAHVVGFVGFVITGLKSTGSQSSRYIQGYFTRMICNSGCQLGSGSNPYPGGGMFKLRMVG